MHYSFLDSEVHFTSNFSRSKGASYTTKENHLPKVQLYMMKL